MDDNLSPQERAERDAHLVKSTDDLAREAAGIPHPEPGHDAGEYLRRTHPALYAEPEGPSLEQRLEEMQARIDALEGQA